MVPMSRNVPAGTLTNSYEQSGQTAIALVIVLIRSGMRQLLGRFAVSMDMAHP